MHRTLTRSTVAVAAALAIGAVSLPAAAGNRSTIAFAGRAKWSADAQCFEEWRGSMTNYCNTARWFIVPITIDAATAHTATITAYGASPSNNVECQAVGVSNDNTVWDVGPPRSLPWFGAAANIVVARQVPAGGAFYVQCLVQPRGVINVVNTSW